MLRSTCIIRVIVILSLCCHFSLNAADQKLQTRLYVINDSGELVAQALLSPDDAEEFFDSDDILKRLQMVIKKQCTPVKQKTYIGYEKSISLLAVTNTPANLAIIEKALSALIGDPSSQVYTELTIIKIPDSELSKYTDVNALNMDAKVKKIDYRKMIESDKTTVLASASILTHDGEEAHIRFVAEKYFPEMWTNPQHVLIGAERPPAEKKDDKEEDSDSEPDYDIFRDTSAVKIQLQKGDSAYLLPAPKFCEPTELGTRLTLTPVINKTIRLDISPVLQLQTGWTNISQQNKTIKMPIISAMTINTSSIEIESGETVMLGGNAINVVTEGEKENKNEHTLFLISSTIVTPDGKAITKKQKNATKNYAFKTIYSGEPLDIDLAIAQSKYLKNGSVMKIPPDTDKLLAILKKELLREQPQICVETKFLKISSANLAEITGTKQQMGMPSADLYAKIIKSGKGKLLANPRVLTKNGEEGQFRQVREEYFAELWSSPEIDSYKNTLYFNSAMPEFSEPTDVGTRLIVTPQYTPASNLIHISLNPQLLSLVGYSDYSSPLQITKVSKKIEERPNLIKMPVIIRTDLMTNISIKNGATICIGKGISADVNSSGEKSDDIIYIFLKAYLIPISNQ